MYRRRAVRAAARVHARGSHGRLSHSANAWSANRITCHMRLDRYKWTSPGAQTWKPGRKPRSDSCFAPRRKPCADSDLIQAGAQGAQGRKIAGPSAPGGGDEQTDVLPGRIALEAPEGRGQGIDEGMDRRTHGSEPPGDDRVHGTDSSGEKAGLCRLSKGVPVPPIGTFDGAGRTGGRIRKRSHASCSNSFILRTTSFNSLSVPQGTSAVTQPL